MKEIIIEVPDDVGKIGEIVRCMNCKYSKDGRCENEKLFWQIVGCEDKPLFYVYGDWFCAWGERR